MTSETAVATDRVKFPAAFSPTVLHVLRDLLVDVDRCLDPFGGIGRLRQVSNPRRVFLNEIEPEWARAGKADTIGNALCLPYKDQVFDAIATSPTWANRLADHHNPKDGSVRRSYKFDLGRALHPHNSGQLHWGTKYRDFHRQAWEECRRVLRTGGILVLNVSDHIRLGKRKRVSAWHVEALKYLGFVQEKAIRVRTKRMRYGANSDKRVKNEMVYLFRRK